MERDEFIFLDIAQEQIRQRRREAQRPNLENMKLPVLYQIEMLEIEKEAVERQLNLLKKLVSNTMNKE